MLDFPCKFAKNAINPEVDNQIKKEDNCRDNEPTTSDGKTPIQWITDNYKPATNAYRTNASSNWSPSTGAYSASVDFVWV